MEAVYQKTATSIKPNAEMDRNGNDMTTVETCILQFITYEGEIFITKNKREIRTQNSETDLFEI